MNFRTQVLIPPGERDFIERVNLQGDFGIDAATFASSTTQGNVDNLSQVAEGEKENDDPADVVENLKGHVVLKNAIATFSDFSFSVPGALARVHGTYVAFCSSIMRSNSLCERVHGGRWMHVPVGSPSYWPATRNSITSGLPTIVPECTGWSLPESHPAGHHWLYFFL